jgi:hypothetical protein
MQAKKVMSFVLAALATAPAAHAAPQLSGSFDSIATDGYFETPSGPEVSVAGTSVTGTFTLGSASSAFKPPAGAGFGPGDFLLPPSDGITFTFDVVALGRTITLAPQPYDDSLIELRDNGVTQSVLLGPAWFDPHALTVMSLSGPEGSLFDSITDPASLHTGEGVSIVSPIGLDIPFVGGANLAVISQSIPVREPPGWFILAIGLFGALAVRRTRRLV